MPPWLAPVVAGISSVTGQLFSNQSNRRMAERSMDFSREMASSQAQRAVKDYAAAGLNPALAYGNPAHSPQGVVGNAQEDVVGKGVSTALAVQAQKANIQLLEAQARKADAEATSVSAPFFGTTPGEPTYRDELMARRRAFFRDMEQSGKLQPHDLRIKELEKILKELQLPGARNTAAFERRLGELRPASPLLFSSARLLSEFLSRRY